MNFSPQEWNSAVVAYNVGSLLVVTQCDYPRSDSEGFDRVYRSCDIWYCRIHWHDTCRYWRVLYEDVRRVDTEKVLWKSEKT